MARLPFASPRARVPPDRRTAPGGAAGPPRRARGWWQAHRAHLVGTLVAVGAYAALFPLLFPLVGSRMAAVGAVPVMLAAYTLGTRAGVIAAALLNLVVTPLLFHAFALPGTPGTGPVWAVPATLGMALLALFVGRMRAVSHQLAQELAARQRAEAALQEREQLYTQLVENASDIIYRADLSGRFTYVNAAALRIMAYREDELVGMHYLDLLRPDVREAALAFYRDQLRDQVESTYYEFPAVTKHGEEVWFGQRVHLVREGRRITGVQAITRDITERKRAEAALVASEQRFRELFESSPDAIFVEGLDGYVRDANPAACRLHGLTREALIGRHARDLVPPEMRGSRLRLFDDLAAGEVGYVTGTSLHASGRAIPVEIRATRATYGGAEVALLYVRDTTERVRAAAELAAQQARYRSVVEHVRDVVFQTDTAGRWTFLNPAWTEITGFPVEESLGRHVFDFVHPDDRQACREQFEPVLARTQPEYRHEIRFLTRQGGFRWIEAFARLTLDEAGGITGTAGTLHDVTQQHQAMEALAVSLEKERELGLLKSRFVSMASHELRTPLTAIKSSAELLERFGDRWDAERRRTLFARILTNVQSMTALVEDVLLLGRADSGRLPFHPEPLDLAAFCAAFVEDFQQGAEGGPPIEADLPAGPLDAEVDPKLLQLILGNLLSNALKYAPPDAPVRLHLDRADGHARLRVSDHGIGIPEADLPRLFEPFHRASNVEARPGTGLGLTIVKRAVDLHGGTIQVESRPGAGTTFTVSLPCRVQPAPASLRPAPSAPA